MRVILEKVVGHTDYVNASKSEKLTVNASKPCDSRDLPCGQKSR